jgi:TetR/AcrR family fatty acid metabolism transcriptional regulator
MMSSSETNRPDKRERITDAAIAVFAEKGYHAARVSDVAKEAGVADGTIYLYFRNKEDLLLSIFEEKMEMLIVLLKGKLDGVECPLHKIRIFSQQHFEQLRTHPLIAQVFQVELRQSHKFLREYRPEKLWEYLNIFGEAVTEAQSKGLIRKEIDPYIAKWSFFGALDELSIQWVLSRNRERFNLSEAADQVVDTFLRGVCTAK